MMSENATSKTVPDLRATLVMVLHHHQPMGNFEHVFQETYDRCYRPTLELLEAYPDIHVSIHLTGALWIWLSDHAPGYLDLLSKLVERRQVEVVGGGFYEPILAALPERSIRAQVEKMDRTLKDHFGRASRGFWLAERVWQTDLPARIASVGLEYAPVDDHHFLLAGFEPEELHGYYRAPWGGHALNLFPISRNLRYLIPFQLPDQLLEFMDRNARGGKVLTYADDAEKFGVWPETYKWVWEEGYLRSLFEHLVRQSGWLRVASMEEIVAERGPTGTAVLPNASYEEMMEWALPARLGVRYKEVEQELERAGLKDRVRPFFRGGIFENFLTKYSDVARLYNRMMFVSRMLAERSASSPDLWDRCEDALLKAQGNDVYWHGLFGGIYLANLRHFAFAELLQAENAMGLGIDAGKPELLEGDFDQDGCPDLFVARPEYSLWIAPGRGGSFQEIDDRAHHFHLTNTMTRQFEAYHARVEHGSPHASEKPAGGGISSIHDRSTGLESLDDAIFDPRPRRAFSDAIAPSSVGGLELDRGQGLEADYASLPLAVLSRSPDQIVLEGKGRFQGDLFQFRKEIRCGRSSFDVCYRLSFPAGSTDTQKWSTYSWITELPFTLLAGEDAGRSLEVLSKDWSPLSWISPSDLTDIRGFRGWDDWSKAAFSVRTSCPVRLVSRPIHTISLSEKGIEKIYQGTLFFLLFPLSDLVGEGVAITVDVGSAISEGK